MLYQDLNSTLHLLRQKSLCLQVQCCFRKWNSCLSASPLLRWSTSPASPLPLIVTFPEAFDLSIAVVPLLLAIQCQQCAHKSLKGKNPAAYIHRNHESSYLRGMRFVAFLLFFYLFTPRIEHGFSKVYGKRRALGVP